MDVDIITASMAPNHPAANGNNQHRLTRQDYTQNNDETGAE